MIKNLLCPYDRQNEIINSILTFKGKNKFKEDEFIIFFYKKHNNFIPFSRTIHIEYDRIRDKARVGYYLHNNRANIIRRLKWLEINPKLNI